VIGTNRSGTSHNSQVQLVSVDEIVMDDGSRVSTGWNGLIADINASGAGGLDTGTVQPNTCYEVYTIRGSSSGNQALLLHRALDRRVDVHHPAAMTFFRDLQAVEAANQANVVNIAQSFQATKSGPFTGIEFSIVKVGSPTGNVWVSLETDDGAGNTTGSILATSRVFDAIRFPLTTAARMRFPFDITANVAAGNTYWVVIHADYIPALISPPNNLNYLRVGGDRSLAYANGAAKFFNAATQGWALANSTATLDLPGGPSNYYFRTFIEANNTSVVMPTGYDQKCLVSYCSTTAVTSLRMYQQRDRTMSMPFHYTWGLAGASLGSVSGGYGANNSVILGTTEVINCGEFVPPIPIVLLTVYLNSGLSLTSLQSFGQLECTDLSAQLAVDVVSGILQNVESTSTINTVGPIPVEHGAFMMNLGGSVNGLIYVGSLEI